MIRSTAWLLLASALFGQAHAYDCSPTEVGYFATFKVKPGSEHAFEQRIEDLTGKVRALEPGTVFYAPYRGDEPDEYYFVERYRNEDARKAHAQADEIRALFEKIMPLLREPVDVKRISALCP